MRKSDSKIKATQVALGGIIAALMAVIMMASYFPYLTYAVPAIAGLFIFVPMIEMGRLPSVLTYIAAAVTVSLTAENEAKILFIVFFGYYPILKAVFEGFASPIAEYAAKFATFNLAVAVYVALSVYVLGVPLSEFTQSAFGAITAPILLVGGNVVFFLYDMGATRVVSVYINTLHPRIKKLLK